MGTEGRAAHDPKGAAFPREGGTLDVSASPSGSPIVWPVQIGEVVDGKYRIERALGTGGMGVVLAARHLALGEPVALKFVRWENEDGGYLAERLKREALATFRLRSEHSVRTLDVGQLPSGAVYIVMELLAGQDLRTALKEQGTLPQRTAVGYALQVCNALEDAHALGIIHRDLKPQNLFLTRRPQGTTILKVLDFGVSKLDPSQFDTAPLTDPEGPVGTPRYMAPEQWTAGAQVDARADVWALGMILYEMLTGGVPNEQRRGAERQALLMAGAIPSPRKLRPDVTPALEAVILRCLRADPERRWRSARRLAAALREAVPDVDLGTEGLPVTRSDVTAVDPSLHRPQALSRAFATGSTRATAPRSIEVPSQALTPRAAPGTFPGRGELPDSPVPEEIFEEATEVSVPRFTGDDTAPRVAAPLKATLRSFEAVVEEPPEEPPTVQVTAVVTQHPRSTPPAAAAPVRTVPIVASTPPPPMPPVPAVAPRSAPGAPPSALPRRSSRARTVALVVLGLAQSVALVIVIVLMAMRC